MTDPSCTYTEACPLPAGSIRHLTGCPGGVPAERVNLDEWRDPGMPEREAARFPSGFWIGYACGFGTASLAVFAGFLFALT